MRDNGVDVEAMGSADAEDTLGQKLVRVVTPHARYSSVRVTLNLADDVEQGLGRAGLD